MLAVDAIKASLSKSVDAIIVLSGDADFVPAVDFIKSLKIETINLHLYSGSSTELRTACDRHILIDFKDSDIILR